MLSADNIQGPPAALLSVVSTIETPNFAEHQSQSLTIAGQSVLEWQLAALQKSGITTCFVEVDNVSGALLKMSDAGERFGLTIHFVRTLEDLQKSSDLKSRLVILAEGLYFSEDILHRLIGSGTPCVATCDIGNESADFERIDLTRCWAGFTLLETGKLGAIQDIPEGWSIASTLLRFAIQIDTPFQPLPQSAIQNAEIAKISSAADAQGIGAKKMQARVDVVKGWIERNIFGAIAERLAPVAWGNASFSKYAHFPAAVAVALSLVLTAVNHAVFALLFIFLGLMLNQIQTLIDIKSHGGRRPIHGTVFWVVSIISALYVAFSEATVGSNAVEFTTIMLGLAALALPIPAKRWAANFLCSPALLVLGMAMSAYSTEYAFGLKIIVFAQLALLLTEQYLARRVVAAQKQP